MRLTPAITAALDDMLKRVERGESYKSIGTSYGVAPASLQSWAIQLSAVMTILRTIAARLPDYVAVDADEYRELCALRDAAKRR